MQWKHIPWWQCNNNNVVSEAGNINRIIVDLYTSGVYFGHKGHRALGMGTSEEFLIQGMQNLLVYDYCTARVKAALSSEYWVTEGTVGGDLLIGDKRWKERLLEAYISPEDVASL